jgi:flagellum-specific peptidoglycan hydrolase FlgJ
MIDTKRLFDQIRTIKGAPLTQGDVDSIMAIIESPLPAAPSIPPHPKIPMDVLAAACRSETAHGIPASVTLAQWALESGWGKAVSGKWNYGGITARVKGAVFPYEPGSALEPATLCWTHEDYKGQRVKCQRWFKDFDSPDDFFDAHARLIGTSPKYAAARAKLPDVDAFVEAMAPTYATDRNYATTIRSIMKSNKLYAYNASAGGAGRG